MFPGRYFSKRYFAGRYWTPAGGIYVQLGGFGQVIGFGLPTVSSEGGPLLIEVPSLGTLLGFGLPSVSGGAARVERVFVRTMKRIWQALTS